MERYEKKDSHAQAAAAQQHAILLLTHVLRFLKSARADSWLVSTWTNSEDFIRVFSLGRRRPFWTRRCVCQQK
jgi:hypothetical protein